MPNTKSAIKRLKTDFKKRARNRARKAVMATFESKFIKAVDEGENKLAKDLLSKCFALIDKSYKKKIINKSKASRKKSRLSLKLHNLNSTSKESTKS